MRYASFSHVGKVRKENQDHCFADGKLFVIADGMGGHAKGALASEIAVATCRECFHDVAFEHEGEVKKTIELAMQTANDRIRKAVRESQDRKTMGSTLSMGYVYKGRLYIGHVGDSRIYMIRDKNIYQLTTDHTYLHEMMVLGQLKEGMPLPPANIVTRALGVDKHLVTDIDSVALKKGDVLLLATDGVTGQVGNDELKQVILSGALFDLEETSMALICEANLAGGIDNATVVLAVYEGEDEGGEA